MSDATARESMLAEILSFYVAGKERERLTDGRGRLERLRTQELLTRHLPPASAAVGRPRVLVARADGTAERIDRVEVGGSAVIVGRGAFDPAMVGAA